MLLAAVGIICLMFYTHRYNSHFLEFIQDIWLSYRPDTTVTQGGFVRGTIYDRNYKELAVSYERVSVYANIREIDDLHITVRNLADILGESEQQLLDRLESNTLRFWLARDISQKHEEQIRNVDLPGIHLHKEFVRYYPQQESAAHLVGFVENNTGLSGMEHYLDKLSADQRIASVDVDSLPRVGEGRPGADGQHLILTVDLKIQQILDRFISENAIRSANHKIGALAMELSSGKLIGYSQLPSFDSNNFHTYSETVFEDIFQQKISVPEQFRLFLRDLSLLESQDVNGIGTLPWSIIGEKRKLGVQLQLWEKLGAGREVPYDFSNVTLQPKSPVPFEGYGQKLRDFETVPAVLSPLQLLTAVARAANGGTSVLPHAFGRFILRSNQTEYLLKDDVTQSGTDLFSENTFSEIITLLSSVGTIGETQSTTIEGTSLSLEGEIGYGALKRHRLVMNLMPAEKPEIAVMVVETAPAYSVEKEGKRNLATEVQDIIASVAALQQVMKNLADMMKPREREEKNFRQSSIQQSMMLTEGEGDGSDSIVITKMPDLTGMSLRKCLRLLQSSGVEVQVTGTGRVIGQEPRPGAALVAGATVKLILERDRVDAEFKKPKEKENSTPDKR